MSAIQRRPLYITEQDVHSLIDMRGAIDALVCSFREQASGEAQNSPRMRARYWGSRLNIMSAGHKSGRFGFKAYAGTNAPTVYHVMLYDAGEGLIGILEARRLSRLRTGAATGVAIAALAPQGPVRLAMIGAGEQALTQLEAAAAVRPLRSVQVFARNRERLTAFCDKVSRDLKIDATPASSAKSCTSTADVVITATDSQTPVLSDAWLNGVSHISTVGANAANRMELELETFQRAVLVVTDDVEQARIEAAEIIRSAHAGQISWESVASLSAVVAEPPPPRSGLTIFKSLGAAIEDIAVARVVYDRAVAAGAGRYL
ncbi:MAG: ornithine cyclodeaminase family protein [Beijerinckiaceae bacterium]